MYVYLTVFQITKLQMGELVYKHHNSFLPRIYDSCFMNENQRGALISYTFKIKPNSGLALPQPAINWNKVPLHTKMLPLSKTLETRISFESFNRARGQKTYPL